MARGGFGTEYSVPKRKGRVIDAGPHADLLARDPGYRELVLAYEEDTKRQAEEEAGYIG